MAINQNHLFEELNGAKCAIVEKNVVSARVEFLRGILEYNGYTVVVVASPPPKAAGVPGGAAGAGAPGTAARAGVPGTALGAGDQGLAAVAGKADGAPAAATPAAPATVASAVVAPAAAIPTAAPAPPETFTVGVTDVVFNPVNAIFGRLLKAPGGHVVTLAYWKQQDNAPDDEKPYFDGK